MMLNILTHSIIDITGNSKYAKHEREVSEIFWKELDNPSSFQ